MKKEVKEEKGVIKTSLRKDSDDIDINRYSKKKWHKGILAKDRGKDRVNKQKEAKGGSKSKPVHVLRKRCSFSCTTNLTYRQLLEGCVLLRNLNES